jgi:uncharacterized repeat protein (TIGR01451 family)
MPRRCARSRFVRRAGERPTRRYLKPLLLGAIVGLLAAGMGAAQSITIDDFSTNQSSLTLTYPPAGTSASSSVSGSGILGGERDLQVNLSGGVIAGNTLSAVVSSGFLSYSQDATISGTAVVQWDGTDGSPTLSPTGLGGVDLTVGGSQDALLLAVFFDDLPINITFQVYTDATHASQATVSLPGLLFSSTSFVVPFSAFTPTLGTGADFTNVGAIVMQTGSSVTAPDLVIDFLQTTSTLTALQTVALFNDVNGNGQADPGDTLRYTMMVSNPTDALGDAATGVAFATAIDPNATLVVGSVTTTQGSVTTGNTAGDGSVAVNIGTIADGAVVTITYDVVIKNPLPAGATQISEQGKITSSALSDLLTDDPTQPGATDPTVIAVESSAAIAANLTWALAVDANLNGKVDPGDTVKYTAAIADTGNQNAAAAAFAIAIDANAKLVAGSVTTTAGTVTTGNGAGDTSVAVALGTLLGGGGTATITFEVQVDDPLAPNVNQISEQGTVTGSNVTAIPTNDPTTPAALDATLTPIDHEAIAQVPTLGSWGLLALAAALLAVGLRRMRRPTPRSAV